MTKGKQVIIGPIGQDIISIAFCFFIQYMNWELKSEAGSFCSSESNVFCYAHLTEVTFFYCNISLIVQYFYTLPLYFESISTV